MHKNVMEFATQKVVSVKSATTIEELSKLFGFSQPKKISVSKFNIMTFIAHL